jgi:hypothetical protein
MSLSLFLRDIDFLQNQEQSQAMAIPIPHPELNSLYFRNFIAVPYFSSIFPSFIWHFIFRYALLEQQIRWLNE